MNIKEIIDEWNNREDYELVAKNEIDAWFSNLTEFKYNNEILKIPNKEYEFIKSFGIPEKYPLLDMNFELFINKIENVYNYRNNRIHNGIEYPELRYKLFHIIASDSQDSCDYCIEKFTGHIYKLGYGSGAFFDRVKGGSGATYLVTTDNPVLSAENSFGPYFLNSSYSKMILCMILIRNIFTKEVLKNRNSKSAYKFMVKKICEIDKMAYYHPESIWFRFIESVKYT